MIRIIGIGIVTIFGLMLILIYKCVDSAEKEVKTIMYFLNGLSLLAGVFVYCISFHIRLCLEKRKEKNENKN